MMHLSSLPGRKPSNTSLYFPLPTFRSTSYPSCSLHAQEYQNDNPTHPPNLETTSELSSRSVCVPPLDVERLVIPVLLGPLGVGVRVDARHGGGAPGVPRGPAEARRHGERRLSCGGGVNRGGDAAAPVVVRGRGGEEEAKEEAVGRGGGGGCRKREDAAAQGAPGHVTAARRGRGDLGVSLLPCFAAGCGVLEQKHGGLAHTDGLGRLPRRRSARCAATRMGSLRARKKSREKYPIRSARHAGLGRPVIGSCPATAHGPRPTAQHHSGIPHPFLTRGAREQLDAGFPQHAAVFHLSSKTDEENRENPLLARAGASCHGRGG